MISPSKGTSIDGIDRLPEGGHQVTKTAKTAKTAYCYLRYAKILR